MSEIKKLDDRDYIIIGLFVLSILLIILLFGLNSNYGTLAELYIERCQIKPVDLKNISWGF